MSPSGGLITVTTADVELAPDAPEVLQAGIGGGRFVLLDVTDTGIGMDDAQIKKAFSVYGQIDSKIARTHQGTGLGLPISQSLK